MDLEHQFEGFLEYVPYLKGNRNTYSFRLANLIQSIGGYIDSAFKEVAKYHHFAQKHPKLLKKVTKGRPTITDYYVLAEDYRLSRKEVTFKCIPERVTLIPFKNYIKKGERVSTPSWWRVYNKVKHEFKDNFEKATLRNTRDALAAAFLLNMVHIPSAVRLCEFGLVTENNEIVTDRDGFRDILINNKAGGFSFLIETPIFRYDFAHQEVTNYE
jgi:hypothetical protein